MQLYTIITTVLGSQAIYYGYIYPRSQYKRLLKVQIPIPILMLHMIFSTCICLLIIIAFQNFKQYISLIQSASSYFLGVVNMRRQQINGIW